MLYQIWIDPVYAANFTIRVCGLVAAAGILMRMFVR